MQNIRLPPANMELDHADQASILSEDLDADVGIDHLFDV